MTYKGYTGVVRGIDESNGLIYGWLADIRDVVSFQGATVESLVREFRESVDDYLEWSAEDGFDPRALDETVPPVLLPAALHKSAARRAFETGTTLNAFVQAAIQAAVASPAVAAKAPAARPLPAAAQSKARPKKVAAKGRKPSA